ncbi:putative deoxynucleotide monophosphate kinase [Delftia phage PhiW-14]|uniref:Putative deoxynucleotide monophosphate kinase n=1 Tax=Delftia phage PhiW-14 TaxID=665032 RepID=C9DGK2_BPW14|nr:putative deoxynucleotide monophosphate kinase [Delftia phage PhiW-14]ACV50253.1 putative deoxynucleotide monophosphate kinase [Delftia phage PhiW-14]
MKNVLCLCGERQRGKDYLTALLGRKFGATRLSFSDEVRRLAGDLHPWFDPWEEQYKERVYPAIENVNNLTGREILLSAGRIRDVDPAYFVKKFMAHQLPHVLAEPDRLFVITDFRTPDEYAGFLEPNGIPTLKVTRDMDDLPHPFEEWIRQFKADHHFHNNPGDEQNDEGFIGMVQSMRSYGIINFQDKQ